MKVSEWIAQLMPQMSNATGVTEQLKAADQMNWVDLMNAVKAQVEEIISAELIYKNDPTVKKSCL